MKKSKKAYIVYTNEIKEHEILGEMDGHYFFQDDISDFYLKKKDVYLRKKHAIKKCIQINKQYLKELDQEKIECKKRIKKLEKEV